MEYRYFENKQLSKHWEHFINMDSKSRARFVYKLGLEYKEDKDTAILQEGLLKISLSEKTAYGSPIQYARIERKLKEQYK